ncbi:Putative D-alanyl-D-alanine carboxypeptidase [Streptomyces tendae]
MWGEVHDENAYSLGGVAGHAGVFSDAWDLAVLARTLLDGGAHGRERILRPESVELMFTDFNTAFPGDEHGLGFELYQHWYMGAMATPRTAGHTGFTGTALVLDPTTDSFLVVLGNSVHPVRSWRSGSAPRVAAANQLARAVPVRPARGHTAWFSGMASAAVATLALPALDTSSGAARLSCALWWDTEPRADVLILESSADGGTHLAAGAVHDAAARRRARAAPGGHGHRLVGPRLARPGRGTCRRPRPGRALAVHHRPPVRRARRLCSTGCASSGAGGGSSTRPGGRGPADGGGLEPGASGGARGLRSAGPRRPGRRGLAARSLGADPPRRQAGRRPLRPGPPPGRPSPALCRPFAASSGPRMDGSVSEWQ